MSGSCSQYSSRSLPETSALLPTLMKWRMPMPRLRAWSRMATPRAPDCDEKATLPAGGQTGAKVASSCTSGSVFTRPRQLGPTRRMPKRRARRSTSSCSARPAGPTSAKPALITTRAWTPLRPQSSTASATWSLGTASTARSTGSGMALTAGKARTDCTTAAERLTG